MSGFRQILQNNTPKDNDAWTLFMKISSWVDDRGPRKCPHQKKGRSNSAELCGTSQLANCTCSTKAQATSLFTGVPQGLRMVLESFWGGKKEPAEKTGFINSADHRNICSTCCPFSSDALTSRSLVRSRCTRCILTYLIFSLSISGQYLAFCIPWAYLDFMASFICDFSSRVNKIHGLATCLFGTY